MINIRIVFTAVFVLILAAVFFANAQIGPPIGGGGGGGGTPCTTTANSLQYNNSGAFGCATEWLYTSAKKSLGDGSNFQIYWSGLNGDLEYRNSADSAYVPIQVNGLLSNGVVSATAGKVLAAGNIFNATTSPVIMSPDIAALGSGKFGFLGCSTCLHSWSSSSSDASTPDTAFARNAAGVVEVDNGTAGTYREMAARSFISKGAVPGISGCTASTQTGGGTVGTYTSGTTGTCTVTLTFAFTAPTGWACAANDLTTPADVQHQSGVALQTTTATITGTTVSGDVINFLCMAY